MPKIGLFLISILTISSAACTTASMRSASSWGSFNNIGSLPNFSGGSFIHASSIKDFSTEGYTQAVLRVRACTTSSRFNAHPDMRI